MLKRGHSNQLGNYIKVYVVKLLLNLASLIIEWKNINYSICETRMDLFTNCFWHTRVNQPLENENKKFQTARKNMNILLYPNEIAMVESLEN